MTTQHRDHLRQIMTLAWQKLRFERNAMGRAYTLNQALVHAWAWFKAAATREAQAAANSAAWAAAGKPITHLRSIMRSPIDRSLSARRYGKTDAYRARALTARLGC